MKVIIIGGVAAGMSAASKLRRENREAEIVVYERGGFTSYSACGLPYFAAGIQEDPDLLIARTPEAFAAMGIQVHLHHEVTAVDPVGRRVTVHSLQDGRVFQDSWDKLLIAVGCAAKVPLVPGMDLPAVFRLKSMEDGLLLREVCKLKDVHHVAVIGGGSVGVEMASALAAVGRQVTLIEGESRLLGPYEPEFAELAAQALERCGVTVLVGNHVTQVRETGYQRIVKTDRREVACDLVIVSTGAAPATAFLQGSGIRLADNGAVIVDDEMRTNLPDIFAAGDCAAIPHRLVDQNWFVPLATMANKCGRIAGANLNGAHQRFPGTLATMAIQAGDTELARTGLSEQDAQRLKLRYKTKMICVPNHPSYYPGSIMLTIKLLYDADTHRLLGACAAGQRDAVLRVDMLALAIHQGMTTEEMGMADLAYAPPFSGVWDAVQVAANAAK